MKNDHKIRKLSFDLNSTRVLLVLAMFVVIFALPVSYSEGTFPFAKTQTAPTVIETYTDSALAGEQGQVAGVSTSRTNESLLDLSEPATIAKLVGGVFGIISISALLYLGYTTLLKR